MLPLFSPRIRLFTDWALFSPEESAALGSLFPVTHRSSLRKHVGGEKWVKFDFPEAVRGVRVCVCACAAVRHRWALNDASPLVHILHIAPFV